VGEAAGRVALPGADRLDRPGVEAAEQHGLIRPDEEAGVGLIEEVVARDGRLGREGAGDPAPGAHELALDTFAVEEEVLEGLRDGG